MKIEILNLDGTKPVPDTFYGANRAGVVRFIGEHDSQGLGSMQRIQGDFVHRDQLIQEKLNEVIGSINTLNSVDDSPEDTVAIPLLPTSPTNKAYVDVQDSALATGIAIVAERLRSLKAMSTFSSDWVEVVWKTASQKERIELTLTNLDGSPIIGLDFDQVVSSSLIIRADVSSVGITDPDNAAEYVYRSATFGQTTGFKLDDIWVTPPNKVSVLAPYTSLFAQYPPIAGYNVSQPSRIWIKAVILTSQPPPVTTTPEMPTLDFNNAEIQAILARSVETISGVASLKLNIPGDASPVFRRALTIGENGATSSSGGVTMNGTTIRFSSIQSEKGKLLGLSQSGDVVTPVLVEEPASLSLRPLFVDQSNQLVVGSEPTISYITNVPLLDDHSNPVMYRNRENGSNSVNTTRNTKVKLTPNTSYPSPAWATKVKVRIELAVHTTNGGNPANCAVRVLRGYDSLPVTSTDILGQAILSWDFGGNVQSDGVGNNQPYQVFTTTETWVPLQADGTALITVQYLLHAKADQNSLSWGLAVIRLLAYGR